MNRKRSRWLWVAAWFFAATAAAQGTAPLVPPLAPPLPPPLAPALAPAVAPALAPASASGGASADDDSLYLNRRPIVTFRGALLGRTPAQRAALGQAALQTVLARGGPGEVTVWIEGGTAGLRVDGTVVFNLVPDDIEDPVAFSLAEAAEAVRARLQKAVTEVKEAGDPQRIGVGLAMSALAVLITAVLMAGLWRLRGLVVRRTTSAAAPEGGARAPASAWLALGQHAQTLAHAAAGFVTWALLLLLADLCIAFVLQQFAYTRPWGERSTQWLLDLLQQFAVAAAGAVPGLLSAVLVFVLARLLTRVCTAFMARVEVGDASYGWLDADTAGPTRRVINFVIWLFALALAYPFLPGASSEAFKGVSVLAGLMLSLGASGVVGQIVSGLSVMYSRTLRPGEYVKIGDVEGTVRTVGLFATKVHTGLGEEVSLPNAVVFSQPVRNFSRLVGDGQFILHTAVTIGYATPWRQVHAMLLEAAARTAGVAQDPAPYVVQTALSDFYVEYRLVAQADRSAPRRRAEAINRLLGHIQDVFNENGVQIMSPHYRSDPPAPQVVPPEQWFAAPAKRPD
ncbi:MAG: mechanosensitive ion channel [Rubrivivax sp.]|nr:mechanosensitive ion channel [Rubrivivax sp.]